MEKKCARHSKKGFWTEDEDRVLIEYVKKHGTGKWNRIAKITELKRSGKSCRLRWINYLSPTVKRGHFSEQEDDLIIRLHKLLGNRWSLIAGRIPGRTDNQVKNYWNTHLSKKLGVRKEIKKKVCVPPKLVSSNDNCDSSTMMHAVNNDSDDHQAEKAVDLTGGSSSSSVDLNLANMIEEILMRDDFGSSFCFGNSPELDFFNTWEFSSFPGTEYFFLTTDDI